MTASSGARQGPSLKARAIALLSRREHSRQELARKLTPHAADADELDRTLDTLTRENWLSNERFVQSLVNRQAARQGSSRILHTLRQHGVDDAQVAQAAEQLRDTELDRARAVWQKKFGSAPADAKEYARQMRFMAYRGFSAELLRKLLTEPPSFDDAP